jgi:hypothetical protein
MVIAFGDLDHDESNKAAPSRLSQRERRETALEAQSPQAIASPMPPNAPPSAGEKITGTLVLIFTFGAVALLSAVTLLLFL